ncbi:10031_t:CDS:10 [Ambispora gerdemannii]|uniref:10031_t:CDS:1 n=1 Tax=Ambispora gerdemannii TaxID=144530 RepID=A0A9N9B9J0_9GLOM|nr:10031_t:CDS:10 [Ambispora gerdemannii]
MLFMFKTGRTMFKETSTFYYVRIVTATLVLLTYTSYLAFLAYQIWTDIPVIQPAHEFLSTMDAPDIEICGWNSDVEIVRCDFTWRNWTISQYKNCMTPDGFQYVYPGPRPDPSIFCYLFTTNYTALFGMDDVPDTLVNIDFYYKITNLTSAIKASVSVATIAMQLFSPDFNPLWNKSIPTTTMEKFIDADFRLQGNNFAGIQNYSTNVKYRKVTYRIISKHDFKGLLGLVPKYDNTSIFVASTTYYPLHGNNSNFTENTDTGHFSVAVGSFVHELKSEKRSHTVLGSLGVAGGGFGLICGIYILLFGEPKTKPWGLMHRMMKSEIAKVGDPENTPLVTPVYSRNVAHLTHEERTTRLEDRIYDLESLLTDYFLDASPLRRAHKRDMGENLAVAQALKKHYPEKFKVVVYERDKEPRCCTLARISCNFDSTSIKKLDLCNPQNLLSRLNRVMTNIDPRGKFSVFYRRTWQNFSGNGSATNKLRETLLEGIEIHWENGVVGTKKQIMSNPEPRFRMTLSYSSLPHYFDVSGPDKSPSDLVTSRIKKEPPSELNSILLELWSLVLRRPIQRMEIVKDYFTWGCYSYYEWIPRACLNHAIIDTNALVYALSHFDDEGWESCVAKYEKEMRPRTYPAINMRWPGIEPGTRAWKACMLTTTPPTPMPAYL